MIEIRAACSPGEVRIAVTDQDILLDAGLWRPGNPDGFDDWHLARIQAPVPSLGGAFITLQNDKSGFLSSRQTFTQGEIVSVRVSRSAQNGKGLRFRTAEPSDIVINEPKLLLRGPSPLEELAERYPGTPILIDAPGIAALLPVQYRPRFQRCLTAFDDTLDAEFDSLESHQIMLGSLSASIFPTPALIAIDLDSAGAPDFKANIASFSDLARQIRLRNLSGTLLIDPAGVKSRKRPALIPFLREALANDPLGPQVLGATPSGLLEVTRQRKRPPLHELLSSPHGKALAMLRQILRENRSGTTLKTSISIARALDQDSTAFNDFLSLRAAPISLSIDPGFPPEHWSLA